MSFQGETIDDFVILRSDGIPTYHLASTVDDVDYQITHVIRGEDLLSSTPKHILLTEAVGGEPAVYAHLPLLFGPDGKKLSKRHGDVSLRAYREGGYLPEAMINFMSLLGWSLDPDRTMFSVDEAIAAFDLSKVSKNPAIFDTDKLAWMNGEYIRLLPMTDFLGLVRPFVEDGLGGPLPEDVWSRFETIAPLVQERVKLLSEAADQVRFLFTEQLEYDQESWRKVMAKEGVADLLGDARRRLERIEKWDHESIEGVLREMLVERDIGAKQGLQPIRVAVTGSSISPPLFESMAILGRELTLRRLQQALARY
jgi:glutamyl-tRNA synthetase